MICILARRGRFLETILQDGARSGVPRTRREPHRREVRTPTASHRAWRGTSLQAPVPLPGAGFVGPHPKIATVERRELSRSPRDGGSRGSQARPKLRVRLSALHPPLIGGAMQAEATTGRKKRML